MKGTTQMKIYLADLTHTGSVIMSSNIFPLAIGLVGSYLDEKLEFDVDIELFKDPSELNERLLSSKPDIVGFSNYSWNEQISLAFAKKIKEICPDTITVFGGPNYGLEDSEVAAYWAQKPAADFYIVKEGEEAMLGLVNILKKYDQDVSRIKESGLEIPNCHYEHNGTIIKGDILPRVDISSLPSPYTNGFLDKFFDADLIPMIHTTRGCPFTCTFCTEGNSYYNKVKQRTTIEEELEYISSRVGDQKDLYLSDANFGMYKQDISKAQLIKSFQEKYNYPERVVVSTGKNQKERVLAIAATLDGSLNLAASVQSTDKAILKNVKRENISLSGLQEVGVKAVDKLTGTYTEIILALPGDNKESHTNSLKDTIDAGFDIIRMYQLILLPQTELNTPESREKYGMMSMYRIMPRSFGQYNILGDTVVVVESEEICIANNTLSASDYLDSRELDLMVEIVHNGKLFEELHGLVVGQGLSWFDFIKFSYDRRYESTEGVKRIFQAYRAESTKDLRPTKEALEAFFAENYDELVSDDSNTNEMASAKAKAIFKETTDVHAFVYQSLRIFLDERAVTNPLLEKYITELETYSLARKFNFYGDTVFTTSSVSFDFVDISANAYFVDFERDTLPEKRSMVYFHTEKQKDTLKLLRKEYGTSFNGLSKLVMRHPYMNKLFQDAKWA